VSFRVKPDRGAEVTAAHVSARIGEAEALVGAATKADAGDGGWQLWHLTWKPKTTVHSGDEIDYLVQLDDGGPPLAISLGKCTYDPWLARLIFGYGVGQNIRLRFSGALEFQIGYEIPVGVYGLRGMIILIIRERNSSADMLRRHCRKSAIFAAFMGF
jgi:hypothetical protein